LTKLCEINVVDNGAPGWVGDSFLEILCCRVEQLPARSRGIVKTKQIYNHENYCISH
jgi:hypothetical protein